MLAASKVFWPKFQVPSSGGGKTVGEKMWKKVSLHKFSMAKMRARDTGRRMQDGWLRFFNVTVEHGANI